MFRFPTQTKAWVRDRTVLTPDEATIKKSAQSAVAFLLAELARRGHRQPTMRPNPSTKQGKATALRATHRPTKARKRGHPRGRSVGAKGVPRRGPEEANPE